jgi:hypothetical protein
MMLLLQEIRAETRWSLLHMIKVESHCEYTLSYGDPSHLHSAHLNQHLNSENDRNSSAGKRRASSSSINWNKNLLWLSLISKLFAASCLFISFYHIMGQIHFDPLVEVLWARYLGQYSVWPRAGRPSDRGSIPGRGERIFL